MYISKINIKKKYESKDYGYSLNNHKCVGPCYKPNANIVHPLYFDIYQYNEVQCPTIYHKFHKKYEKKEENDDMNFEKKIKRTFTNEEPANFDMCKKPTENKQILTTELLMNTVSPFSKKYFLKIYYDIENFDDIIVWIKNNSSVPFATKCRIINAGLFELKNSKNYTFFSEEIVKIYNFYVGENKMDHIYDEFYKMVGIEDGEVKIVHFMNNNLKKTENKKQRNKFIYDLFFNKKATDDFFNYLPTVSIEFSYDYPFDNIFEANIEYIKKNYLKNLL